MIFTYLSSAHCERVADPELSEAEYDKPEGTIKLIGATSQFESVEGV